MFPYLAPIKDWTVEVFKDREENPIDANLKMPWMILTSGAKVLKEKIPENATDASKAYENLIKNNDSSFLQYSGCIIKNNTSPELNYQLNETILGFDFDGKPIKIPNYPPQPIKPNDLVPDGNQKPAKPQPTININDKTTTAIIDLVNIVIRLSTRIEEMSKQSRK